MSEDLEKDIEALEMKGLLDLYRLSAEMARVFGDKKKWGVQGERLAYGVVERSSLALFRHALWALEEGRRLIAKGAYQTDRPDYLQIWLYASQANTILVAIGAASYLDPNSDEVKRLLGS